MELTEEQQEKITATMASMECQKDFRCYKSGLDSLCKATDVGMKGYVNCLYENQISCEFRVAYGSGFFCRCPLRVYIAKNLGI